jgi:hypothetical protein
VNPRGTDTHYYFQYGETTAYGSATGEGDAGSGMGLVSKSNTITSLLPGVTYHYRIVAKNSAGQEVAGNDRTFTTLEPETSSRWALQNPGNGEQWAYYQGLNAAINYWGFNGKEWFWFERAGHPAAAGTTPTVVRNAATSEQWAYYQGANGSIEFWRWTGSEWVWSELAGHPAAAGTSPSAVRNPVNGFQFVYYQGANGNIDDWGWNGKEWFWYEHAGHAAAAGTSPTVIRNPANGEERNEEQFVYYQGANGNIDYWGWNGKEWFWLERPGHAAAAGTSPSAVRNPVNGFQFVYYQGANGNIDDWGWNAKEWFWYEHAGHPAAAGTSPSVIRNPANGEEQNEEQFVYYQGSNGFIDYWGWNGKEWFWFERPGHPAAAGTSPAAVRSPANGAQGEEQYVYYESADGNVDYWGWNVHGWFWYERPGHEALPTSESEAGARSAMRNPVTNEQYVYYRGSNNSIDYWGWNKEWYWFERPGHAAAAGTTPTVIQNPVTAEQWVFYQTSGGAIGVWAWNGKEWVYSELSGHAAAAGTNPTAIRSANTHEMWVYYQGTNGNIDQWAWNGKEWIWSELAGHTAAAGTSPTAIRNPVNGYQDVYYQGANGNIDYWGWAGKGWVWFERAGHTAAAGTSPTVVRSVGNGEEQTEEQYVYYQGSNGSIDYWGWNIKGWFWFERPGHAAAAGTSPSAVRNPVNGYQDVYYQGANGNIDYWGFNGKEWVWFERAGHAAAAGASPTAVLNPDGEAQIEEQYVYYEGANGNIDDWGWNFAGWFWFEHPGHPV